MTPPAPTASVRKIIVAVHGIGDQVRNETVLSTAIRFCQYYGYEGMVPLGAFHELPPPPGVQPPPDAAFFIDDPPPFPPCPGLSNAVGFVEVHWADIARKISDDHYILQETKAWARSIVQRVRMFAVHHDAANADIDYRRIGLVLEEIVDTIRVLESLLFLSSKAGLGEFKLREVLDAFIGDVQLVTEFRPVREAIVQRFLEVMTAIGAKYPDAEIHVVAHSEGTVVSFLGLLEASRDPAHRRWLGQVRGLMTLGSPIDKHLILWPRIFDRYKGGHRGNRHTIHWVNYVDYADPVGFDLDTAREWLTQRRYADTTDRVPLFSFRAAEDFSFRRYPIPGKAHVDYWNDPEVFGDFIRRVVDPQPMPPAAAAAFAKGPPSLWWVPLITHGVAYLVPFAVLHLGVYLLCKAIYGYFDPEDHLAHPNFVQTVLALSWLVAGTTVWLRLVRLTRSWRWFWLGLLLYLAGVGVFAFLVGRMAPVSAAAGSVNELAWFEVLTRTTGWPLGAGALAGSLAVIALVLFVNAHFWRRGWRALFP